MKRRTLSLPTNCCEVKKKNTQSAPTAHSQRTKLKGIGEEVGGG